MLDIIHPSTKHIFSDFARTVGVSMQNLEHWPQACQFRVHIWYLESQKYLYHLIDRVPLRLSSFPRTNQNKICGVILIHFIIWLCLEVNNIELTIRIGLETNYVSVFVLFFVVIDIIRTWLRKDISFLIFPMQISFNQRTKLLKLTLTV